MRTWILLPALAIVGVMCDAAAAQSTSLFGSSGSGTSQSSRSSRSSTANAAGTAGSSGRSASGGLGGGGLANGGTGSFGTGPQFGQLGVISANAGQGFIGRSNSDTFVGSRVAGQTTANGASANFGAGGGGGQRNSGGDNSNRNGNTAVSKLQPQYRVAFTYAVPPKSQVTQKLERQLTQLTSDERNFAGVNVSLNDAGTVELTGSVATADQSAMLEALVRMEPGVKDVKNNLTTGESSGSAPYLPE